MDIRLLEITGIPRILIYMLKKPECQKVEFRKVLGLSSTTAIKCQKILFECKLITTKPVIEKHLLQLTEKGYQIARLLEEIDGVLTKE